MGGEDIPTVTYFLVLLHPAPDQVTADPPWSAHVAFIDSLVELDVILLGGDFGSSVAGAEAAYVLHTSTRQEAETWTHKDPLVLHRVLRAGGRRMAPCGRCPSSH